MRAKVKEGAPHWRKAEDIQARYARLCQRLHMATDLFTLNFETIENSLTMSFRKDPYQADHKKLMFGKNIIITDNTALAPDFRTTLLKWNPRPEYMVRKDV